MKISSKLCGLALLLVCANAFAKAPTVVELCDGDNYSSDPKAPVQGRDDPFYPGARIAFGKYKGRCFDTSWERPVKVLTPEQEKMYGGAQEGYFSVANFSHKGRFWIARIPVGAITEVDYQLDKWGILGTAEDPNKGPPAGHVEIRFRFSTPVILTPQVKSLAYPASEIRLDDLIYSVEIIGPKGVGWGLDAFLGRTGAVGRFVSMEDKARHFFVDQQHQVVQYKTNIDPERAERLLKYAAARAERLGLTTRYQSLFKNCVTESLATVDEAFKGLKGYPSIVHYIDLPKYEPPFITRSLWLRKLVPGKSQGFGRINDLNTEFPDMHYTPQPKPASGS